MSSKASPQSQREEITMETLAARRERIRREIRQGLEPADRSALFLDDSEPPAHLVGRRPRTRQPRQVAKPRRTVIIGYEPSTTHRAHDGTELYDPIVRELPADAWDGLHEIAANIVGAKLHRVLAPPSVESDTPEFAKIVAQQMAYRESLLNQSACGIITEQALSMLQEMPEIPLGCRIEKAAGQPDPRKQVEAERIPFRSSI